MTLTPQRRVARTAVVAGLAAALAAAGPIPLAFSADGPPAATAPADGTVTSAQKKLGSDDADLLAEVARLEADGTGRKDAIAAVARSYGLPRRVVYNLVVPH